ncbi:MAG: hypothetical protein WC967_13710 [Balneolaceae bacterium]
MIFGLPWFAIIPIVAIVGGLLLSYRKQELEYEAKTRSNSKEVQELRAIIQNLKTRIENLETIATAEKAAKASISLDDIEIKDNPNSSSSSKRVNN